MINRACVFSKRPYTSQIEEQTFLRLDLCTLKLTQKIQALVYFLYNLRYVIVVVMVDFCGFTIVIIVCLRAADFLP